MRDFSQGKKQKKICAISEKCGGCQYLDIPYLEECKQKQKNLQELFGKIGKVDPIIGMKNPSHYRNKVHAVLHRKKDGTVIAGVYEEKSHRVLPVNHCYIENEKASEIIQDVTKLLKDFKITIYNENSEYGFAKHLLVRMGVQTGQIMLTIVTTDPCFPSKNNFVKAVRKLHPEITTIIQNINPKRTSMVLGTKEQTLYGRGFIEDTLLGKTFRISSQSFYQINSLQTEVLYQKAIDLLDIKKTDTILDAYCGTGTIGILSSNYASEVIGVELNPDAVKDARLNAKRNQIKNISFYQNDAGKFMTELKEQGKNLDAVIMDPPRTGCSDEFLTALLQTEPERILYISCGPETLKRDLLVLTKKKYRVKKICPVDMFARTAHIECVIGMQRKDT